MQLYVLSPSVQNCMPFQLAGESNHFKLERLTIWNGWSNISRVCCVGCGKGYLNRGFSMWTEEIMLLPDGVQFMYLCCKLICCAKLYEGSTFRLREYMM
jgi:hypothetical protein